MNYIGSFQTRINKDIDVLPLIFEQINSKRTALGLLEEDELDYIEIFCQPTSSFTATGYVHGDEVMIVTLNNQSDMVMDLINKVYQFKLSVSKEQTRIECIKFNYDCEILVKYGYSDFN